ncbi:MAG TPA: HNH endonuclease [Pyrinomonadaceae bacterium]|jgi:type II secretory pathway component PulF
MRDEYTALREEQDRISLEFEKQRMKYAELENRRAEVQRQLHVLRERVVSAQGEQCAYCGAHLRSNRSYQLDRELCGLGREGLILGNALAARRVQDPISYERRVAFQIRLKVPKSRGGSEVMENLVACCDTCGSKKNKKTHDEFLRQIEGERARAAVAQKRRPLQLVPPAPRGGCSP